MWKALIGAVVIGAAAMLAPSAAGAGGDVSANIVGGVVETRDQPFVVAPVFKRGGGSAADRTYCGGALIAPRYVVTAGHCISWPDSNDGNITPTDISVVRAETTVVIGRNVMSSGLGDRRTIQSITFNPNFSISPGDGLPRWDAAVIRLSSPSTKKPILIAGTGNAGQWANGKTVQVFGHGITDANDEWSVSNELKRTRLTITSQYWTAFGFLAKPFGGSDCSGDSGGPVTVGGYPNFRLIGLVSAGPASCTGTSRYALVAKDGRPGALPTLHEWVVAQLK